MIILNLLLLNDELEPGFPLSPISTLAYGKNIKLRVIEDIQNRNKVANLLRFYSTKDLMIYKF
jgi:hypothetical protein